MKCPYCGGRSKASDAFCPHCGEPFPMQDEATAVASNKPLIIALAAVLFALLLVTFLAFTGKLGRHDPDPVPVAAATETPEETAAAATPAPTGTPAPTAMPSATPQPTPTPAPTPVPTPTPAPTVPPEASAGTSDGYILPESGSRAYSEAELANLSDRELLLARNEIYARHGFLFSTDWIRGYFLTKSWYQGTIPPNRFSADVFNSFERSNIDLIQRVEAQRAG